MGFVLLIGAVVLLLVWLLIISNKSEKENMKATQNKTCCKSKNNIHSYNNKNSGIMERETIVTEMDSSLDNINNLILADVILSSGNESSYSQEPVYIPEPTHHYESHSYDSGSSYGGGYGGGGGSSSDWGGGGSDSGSSGGDSGGGD